MLGKPKDNLTQNDRVPSLVQQLQGTAVAASEPLKSADEISSSKYPPAKPGALVLEPLKAAYPCRTTQASLPLCGMLHTS